MIGHQYLHTGVALKARISILMEGCPTAFIKANGHTIALARFSQTYGQLSLGCFLPGVSTPYLVIEGHQAILPICELMGWPPLSESRFDALVNEFKSGLRPRSTETPLL